MPRRALPPGPDSNHQVNTERQRACVRLLREAGEEGIQLAKLAKELDLSDRSVQRCIVLLQEQGAIIDRFYRGQPRTGFYRMVKPPSWEKVITSNARLALQVASGFLREGGSSLWSEHLNTIEEIAELQLSDRDRSMVTRLRQRIVVHGTVQTGTEPSPQVLARLLLGLGQERTVQQTISYHSSSNNAPKAYTIVPWALCHDIFGGSAFLVAFDIERNIPINLNLGRLQDVAEPGRTYILSRDAQAALERAAKYQIGGWMGQGDPFTVTVRVLGKGWIKAFLEHPPALPEIKLEKEPGGSLLVRFSATELKAPCRWVMQMGSEVEVISPAGLKRRVMNEAKELLARHSQEEN